MRTLTSNKTPIILWGKGILLTLALVLVFTTCDIGLGKLVNTEKPIIQNAGDNNLPGSFMQGTDNKVELNVENKLGFKIETVFMEVEYVDKDTGELTRKNFPASKNPETGKWEVALDVSDMEDGQIKAWVTAIDEDGNDTTSTEITYFVKNKLPQIEMTIPVINTEKFDDTNFLNMLVNSDPVFRRFSLMGVATDNYGIMPGFPKIMIWPADHPTVDGDDYLPIIGDNGIPADSYGYWYAMEDIPEGNTTATRFSWPMLNLINDPTHPSETSYPLGAKYRLPVKGSEYREEYLPLGYYRFRIWVKDRFGNDNYYPNRTDTTRGPDDPSKKYIEIKYSSASSQAFADLTEYPQYYNMAGNLDLKIYLDQGELEMHPTTPVMVAITTTNDTSSSLSDNILWSGAASLINPANTHEYKVTITNLTAAAWTIPPNNRLYIKVWPLSASNETGGPVIHTPFQIDKVPPSLTIDKPIALTKILATGYPNGGVYEILYPTEPRPKWVTGVISVGGVPSDNLSGVKQIWYHIGKLEEDNLTDAGRIAIYENSANWKNTNLHTATPVNDSVNGNGVWSGTQYSWTWTNTFANEYRDSHTSLIQMAADLGYTQANSGTDWAYRRTDGDRVRFYLPFYVKVEDNAGNFRIIHYTLCVDPKMDEPQVTITQPEVKYDGPDPITPIVGGTVRIAGFAEDNNWMHTVLVRVKKGNKASANPYNYLPEGATLFYNSNPSFPKPMPNGQDIDTTGWFEAGKIGDSNNVNWYSNINGNRELNPSGSTPEPVTVQVVAIDCNESDTTHQTPKLTGPVETLELLISKNVPEIAKPTIRKDGLPDRTWADGIRASGNFSVIMDISAVSNINTLTVRINNNASAITLIENTSPKAVSGWTISGLSQPQTGWQKRTITYTIDSTTLYAYGRTGDLTLEVYAEDNTTDNLSATNVFSIGVDNFYPTAEIQTPHIASENVDKDKYYFVLGNAKDYGTGSGSVQGLERVLVYFERATISYTNGGSTRSVTGNSTYINPSTGTVLTNSEFENYPNVLDYGTATTGIVAPNVSSYARKPKITYTKTIIAPETWAYTSNSALVIDSPENGPNQDTDKDGTLGELWNGPSADKEFGARVNFTGWTDGPYIVHYLVMDLAGNATHYQNDIYVENKKPRITAINFGTDINGVGGVTDGSGSTLNEYLYAVNEGIPEHGFSSVAGVMSPSFRIRGNAFSVKLDIEKGNAAKTASATAVNAGTTDNATNMRKGYVYTIVSQAPGTGAMTDFTKFGAPNNIPGTTFVAYGPATGTGTVTPYTTVGTPATASLGTGTTGSGTISFTNFTGIGDSSKNSSGEILGANRNQKFFIIKVYDTTITSTPTGATTAEYDQLADVLLVKLDIDNNDGKNPSIIAAPLGIEYITPVGANPANDGAKQQRVLPESEYSKNVSMKDGVKDGYVQYAYNAGTAGTINTTGTADISGKVKFLGKAEDNQRIAGIYVTISNYTGAAGTANAQFQIAARNTTTGKIEPVASAGAYAGQWAFTVLGDDKDYLTLDYGHTLNWEFMWDSSKVTSIARTGVTVTFEVRDAANRTATSALTVNVVPYILEVETPLSYAYSSVPSAFSRSALGGYPVRETESITIKGFNLSTADVKIGSVSLTGLSATAEGITGTVPTGAVSGPLVVTVNSVASFNNRSNKTKKTNGDWIAPYNQEPNGTNNNILDNSRYIYVWTTGIIDDTNPSLVFNPFMRMDNRANILLSYGYYSGLQSTGRILVNRNGTIYEAGAGYSNRVYYTTVATGGSNNSWYAAGSDSSSSSNRGFQFGRSTPAGTNTIADHSAQTTHQTNPTPILLASLMSSSFDRFMIPRIAVQPTGAVTNGVSSDRDGTYADRILMSYYDNESKKVMLLYGNAGAGATVGNITAGATATPYTPTVSAIEVASSDTVYTAIGFLDNGLPVVTWFDNNKLYLSWDSGATTGNGGMPQGTDINSRVTLDNTRLQSHKREVDSGKGAHVDMVVDAANNVHLAYYDLSNGGLHYARIAPSSAALKDPGNRPTGAITKAKVDTFLAGGTKIMINVRNNIPYITYYHGTFTETKNAIRVAWQKSATLKAGTDAKDFFTGDWEVMTVPVKTVPKTNEFICNGVPSFPTGWATKAPSGSSTYADIDKSIMVGYLTVSHYEGAILKGDMTATIPELVKPTP